ncbi:MAG: tryptophan-rich sensory protein [Candidatus Pacebacteria bacterium]|nr:tryptophan-rich sensory protein [Candidatus Paceibacterota bacterium]MBP9840056.1 tryptophan-rich sensory protein [Candidatus Paceibacterota bacterium]
MTRTDYAKLAVALIVPQATGALGTIFTTPALADWYDTINRPSLVPPDWVFGVVWPTLFFLMGIAAFLVWRKGLSAPFVRIALSVFLFQLVLNMLWSYLFFGIKSLGGAAIEVMVLWAAILATIVLFARVSRTAAWLLVPYLLWVSFATYLNVSIYFLN